MLLLQNDDQVGSNTLQFAPLDIVSNEKCQSILTEYTIQDDQICAGSPTGEQAECKVRNQSDSRYISTKRRGARSLAPRIQRRSYFEMF